MLRSCCLQCSLDGGVEINARFLAEANETLDQLALAVEDECLWNRVLVSDQKRYKIFVRARERVLDAELFRERGDELFVAWPTNVEPDNSHALFLILLL